MYFSFVNEAKALTIYKTKKLFGGESVREKSSSTDLFKKNNNNKKQLDISHNWKVSKVPSNITFGN